MISFLVFPSHSIQKIRVVNENKQQYLKKTIIYIFNLKRNNSILSATQNRKEENPLTFYSTLIKQSSLLTQLKGYRTSSCRGRGKDSYPLRGTVRSSYSEYRLVRKQHWWNQTKTDNNCCPPLQRQTLIVVLYLHREGVSFLNSNALNNEACVGRC